MGKSGKLTVGIVVLLLILITLFTNFVGNTDINDYAGTSKFLAGKYKADIRSSHSYYYGFLHSPFLKIMDSFVIFKITSLVSLLLIVYSVYFISGKDKKALWLMLLSPVVWYLGPWISPIQIASLFFLWGYYFFKKYDKDEKLSNLFFAGLLVGFSYAFWDSIIFFIVLLAVSFLYDKKLIHSGWFVVFLLIGVGPRLLLDQVLFNFAFFSVIRSFFANLVFVFLGGFYDQAQSGGLANLIWVLPFIPYFSYMLFKKKIFKENRKSVIFVVLSAVLIILNSQIRFLIVILPIVFLITVKHLNRKQLVTHFVISGIVILLVVVPYVIQFKYELNNPEFSAFIHHLPDNRISDVFREDLILRDLEIISREYPNEVFVVGPATDVYSELARFYWGGKVKEFVSIQDYGLYLEGDDLLFEREYCTNTRIRNRRDICASMSMIKAESDNTDYESIDLAIGVGEPVDLEGFVLEKEYRVLYLSKKI